MCVEIDELEEGTQMGEAIPCSHSIIQKHTKVVDTQMSNNGKQNVLGL